MKRDVPVPLSVLVSGSGTTLQAIIDAIGRGELPCRIDVVVSDRPGAGALQRAEAVGIPTAVVDRRAPRAEFSVRLGEVIPDSTRLVVLAGFLSIVGEPLLTRFRRSMINIHPSLLPDFGGRGMYGEHVHRAVIASGARRSGCTVHYVDAGTDTGEVILQRSVPVVAGDTPESLASRLRPEEHRAIRDAILTVLPLLR